MRRGILALVALAALWPRGTSAADIDVDLELVLAVDISQSMDPQEQQLQRQGYVQGLQDAEVINAIRSGPNGRIAVTYVEWAGPAAQRIVVPWTVIDSMASATAFADSLGGMTTARMRGTSISGALDFSAALFDENGYQGVRRTIDVSGDGPNNMGGPVLASRDAAVRRGITVNGLPIMLKTQSDGMFSIRDLDVYYQECVVGGPGAFLVTVSNVANLQQAIRRKLVLEIARTEPQDQADILPAQYDASPATGMDCLVGEKMRQRWMQE